MPGRRCGPRQVWGQLRDRTYSASQTLRSNLYAELGDPGEPTMTDDELLVWSRRLADQLLEPVP